MNKSLQALSTAGNRPTLRTSPEEEGEMGVRERTSFKSELGFLGRSLSSPQHGTGTEGHGGGEWQAIGNQSPRGTWTAAELRRL